MYLIHVNFSVCPAHSCLVQTGPYNTYRRIIRTAILFGQTVPHDYDIPSKMAELGKIMADTMNIILVMQSGAHVVQTELRGVLGEALEAVASAEVVTAEERARRGIE